MEVKRSEDLRSFTIKALAATCYSRLTLLERHLDRPLPEIQTEFEFECGLLAAAQVGDYVALVPGARARYVRARLTAGDHCFAVRHRERLVAVSWAASGTVHVPYLRGVINLPRDVALVDGAFAEPTMRRMGAASFGGVHRLSWLRAAGYQRVLAAILPENAHAFGPPEKLGYSRIGTVYGIGLGPFRHVFVFPPLACRLSRRRRAGSGRRSAPGV
jgi:hypothetical protein